MSVKIVNSSSNPTEIRLEAVIFRACKKCGLPNPEPHSPDGGVPQPWMTCPRCGVQGTQERKGVIAYWHRNPLVRAFHRIRDFCKQKGLLS